MSNGRIVNRDERLRRQELLASVPLSPEFLRMLRDRGVVVSEDSYRDINDIRNHDLAILRESGSY